MFVVISYDVPADKRRLKLARALLDYGGERVQKSVFECHLSPRNFQRLQAHLARLYDPEADSIRFYIVCENCRPKALYLGVAAPTEEPGLRII
jgi:CRISPR-associated protein Cas2